MLWIVILGLLSVVGLFFGLSFMFGGGDPVLKPDGTPYSSSVSSAARASVKSVGKMVTIISVSLLICVLGYWKFGYLGASQIEERRLAEAKERSDRDEIRCESASSAYYISQEFVKKHLKSPRDAEFPYFTDDDVKVTYLGGCAHDVWAYVDSKNSFNAIVRTKYYARVKNNKGTDEWQVLDIKI
ncbi:hypothetical protein F9Z43_14885 [Pseudomonas monteilii]|uniref:Uncharacterized protein n=1 Tax=Pseudomonas monteilii TaxID=76759 RepID=A0A7X3F332_9PSED|nr:hypothetical protein [Pseudomonas monteilii]MVF50578.1 hypothetical protein [Pseudomonas monteilii]